MTKRKLDIEAILMKMDAEELQQQEQRLRERLIELRRTREAFRKEIRRRADV